MLLRADILDLRTENDGLRIALETARARDLPPLYFTDTDRIAATKRELVDAWERLGDDDRRAFLRKVATPGELRAALGASDRRAA